MKENKRSDYNKQSDAKWAEVIKTIKDGKSKKVRRDTVIIGVTSPFGTLTRNGEDITFEPAKKLGLSAFTLKESEAAEKLTDYELIIAFNAY